MLDRHLWFELEDVSSLSEGNLADGEPPWVEQVGVIPTPEGHRPPVRLIKTQDADGVFWAFSPATGWDDLLVPRLARPPTLAWSLAVLRLLLPYLALYAPAEESMRQVLRAGGAVALLWGFWRAIDVSAQFLIGTAWGRSNLSARSLLAGGCASARSRSG